MYTCRVCSGGRLGSPQFVSAADAVIEVETGCCMLELRSHIFVNFDVLQLRGNDGETSCTLKANIYKGCNLSPPLTFSESLRAIPISL